MPLLTPHWDTPRPKNPRSKSTSEEIKERRKLANRRAYKKQMDKAFDPARMSLLERSSLDRSRLAELHRNKDIIIGKAWGPIVARRIARCIEAMNKNVDVLVLTSSVSKPPFTEYNIEYFDVYVRYHRTTFDGQRVLEVGEIN
jgi:hypothetical protein